MLSLQQCEDQGIYGKLKEDACNNVFAILTTYLETRFKIQKLKRLVGMPYVLINLCTMIAFSTIDS